LQRQRLEESFQLGKGRMQGCLAQLSPDCCPFLFGKIVLEGYGLLEVKCLEITVPGIGLKTT